MFSLTRQFLTKKARESLLVTSFITIAPLVSDAVVLSDVQFNFNEDHSGLSGDGERAQVPWTLNSLTIGTGPSAVTYSDFITPSSYQITGLTPGKTGLDGVTEIRVNGLAMNPTADGLLPIGDTSPRMTSSNPLWEAQAGLAFQSRNLNYLQQIDGGNNDDTWRLNYGGIGVEPIAGLFIVVTERLGNNPFGLEAFDSSGNSLGTLDVPLSDYSETGAYSLGTNQNTNNNRAEEINAAVYPIADLTGANTARISYIEITNTDDTGGSDGGDGKIFLFGDGAAVPEPSSASLLAGLAAVGFASMSRRRSRASK